jgi:hypothetical protein
MTEGDILETLLGLLKKAASGVLANFPCSRTGSTLCAQNWLRPCWTNFFERPVASDIQRPCGSMCPWELLLFNTPLLEKHWHYLGYVELGQMRELIKSADALEIPTHSKN